MEDASPRLMLNCTREALGKPIGYLFCQCSNLSLFVDIEQAICGPLTFPADGLWFLDDHVRVMMTVPNEVILIDRSAKVRTAV
jgi:hypothetical protein